MKHYIPTYANSRRLLPGEARACDLAGLLPYTVLTIEQTAAKLGVSRQAVQQLERRALWKLRQAFSAVIKADQQ